ncbi:rhombosortase [Inhella sp.]|uniref:rhombosortase n=1 Tax=Inhella sp. TaxID=1921806 RepID=UPI0035B2B354
MLSWLGRALGAARADHGRVWMLVCALFGSGALLLFAVGEPGRWTLQRDALEPWRLFSAALWHWNALHLAGNLAALAVLALLGRRAALPLRAAAAWLLAWPMTQALLLLHPALPEFGGLSGVVHAGVLIAGLHLLRRQRVLGLLLLAGLMGKLLVEQPWGPLLRPNDWWGGASLPLAHATGVLSGLIAAGLLRRRTRR